MSQERAQAHVDAESPSIFRGIVAASVSMLGAWLLSYKLWSSYQRWRVRQGRTDTWLGERPAPGSWAPFADQELV
jgi:hypothetical protein